jgi:hypothetical protein
MGLIEYVQFKPKQATVPARETKKKGRKKWDEIDRYIVDRLIPSDHALDAAFSSVKLPNFETIASRPIRASFLCCLHRP